MKLAYVDHGTTPLQAAQLQAIAANCFAQLQEAAGVWNLAAPEAFRVACTTDALDDDEYEIGRFDTPDQPGDLGYHTVDARGKPYGKWFESVCDGVPTPIALGGVAEQTVASHESLELWADRYANMYAMRSDGQTLDALELCDAVEDVTYPAADGSAMSDYLTPAAFDAGLPGKWDRCGALTSATDTTPGGYRIIIVAVPQADGTASMKPLAVHGPKHVMGMAGDGNPKEMARQEAKLHPQSRASQRGVGVTGWMRDEDVDHVLAARPVAIPLDEITHEVGKMMNILHALPADEAERGADEFIERLRTPPAPYVPPQGAELEALRERIRETLRTGKVAIKPIAPTAVTSTRSPQIVAPVGKNMPVARAPIPAARIIAPARVVPAGKRDASSRFVPAAMIPSKRSALPVPRGDKYLRKTSLAIPPVPIKPMPMQPGDARLGARVPALQRPVKPSLKVIEHEARMEQQAIPFTDELGNESQGSEIKRLPDVPAPKAG